MKRLALSLVLLIMLASIGGVVFKDNIHPPLSNSFETLFNMFGKPVKTLDRSFTKIIGVTVKDERELGKVMAEYIKEDYYVDLEHPYTAYLNSLIQEMASQYNPKGLDYQVFVMNDSPNAFALPGGVIVMTTGMLDILETEAQLVSILGHEKGHIDIGHCIDGMRLAAKRGKFGNGNFISKYIKWVLRTNFSKQQETEADKFGFETLLSLQYEPLAMGEAFGKFVEQYGKTGSYGLLRDYFKTHPSSEIREENWREKAKRWHALHPNTKTYQGKQNYANQQTRKQKNYPEEWGSQK